MTWPVTKPESKYEIPHTQGAAETLESMDEATARGLFELMHTYGDDFESVSAGDPDKEKVLGDLVIRSAVYAANRRERVMRGMPTQ